MVLPIQSVGASVRIYAHNGFTLSFTKPFGYRVVLKACIACKKNACIAYLILHMSRIRYEKNK